MLAMLHKVEYFEDNPPSIAKSSFLPDEAIPSLSFPIEDSAVTRHIPEGHTEKNQDVLLVLKS